MDKITFTAIMREDADRFVISAVKNQRNDRCKKNLSQTENNLRQFRVGELCENLRANNRELDLITK